LDHGVEGTKEFVVPDHEMRFGPQRLEDSGQLDGDVAGADKDGFLGLLVDFEEAVRGDAVFGTRDLFRDDRVSAWWVVSNKFEYGK
jgi:hypothetical protein